MRLTVRKENLFICVSLSWCFCLSFSLSAYLSFCLSLPSLHPSPPPLSLSLSLPLSLSLSLSSLSLSLSLSLSHSTPCWARGQGVRLGSEDPWFESRLRRDFFGSSHTSDFKIGTPVATLPGAFQYRVSTGTGRPGVSIL